MAMQSSNQPAEDSAEVWVVGVVPPPVTGMTTVTQQIVNHLSKAGPITFCDWSPGTSRQGLIPWARRVRRMLFAILRLLLHGRRRASHLYITANSKGAVALTALLVFTGCWLRYRVYLHHHTYVYLERYNRWISWIDRCMTGQGVHIVHCVRMADDFRRMYKSKCEFYSIFPSIVSLDVQQPRTSLNRPFRLGHLSNLSVAKGLDLAIRTFRILHDQGTAVQLRLAGPCQTKEAQLLVNEILASHPESVRYLGPIYDEEKRQFFAGIDAFLFPTRNESWGIVINEALASGVPVITFDRGCTQTVVGPQAGVVLDPQLDFATAAAQQVGLWIDSPAKYIMMSEAAIRQARFLHREAQSQVDEFVSRLFEFRVAARQRLS